SLLEPVRIDRDDLRGTVRGPGRRRRQTAGQHDQDRDRQPTHAHQRTRMRRFIVFTFPARSRVLTASLYTPGLRYRWRARSVPPIVLPSPNDTIVDAPLAPDARRGRSTTRTETTRPCSRDRTTGARRSILSTVGSLAVSCLLWSVATTRML